MISLWLTRQVSRPLTRPPKTLLECCSRSRIQVFRLLSTAKSSKPKPKVAEAFRLISLWKPERWRVASAVSLLMISSGVTMSVPFAMGKIIDTIYVIDQNKDEAEQKAELEERLKKICAILTGVFVVGALCNMGRVYLIRVAAQNITARIRNMCYSSIMSKNITFFDKNKTGELINRLSADSQLVSQTITQQVSDGLRSGMMTLFGVGMMVYMSPSLALMGLMVVPLASAWAVVMGRKVKAVSRQVQDSLASATDLAEERIANIRTVNAFAKQHLEINEYEKRMQTVLDISAAEANIHAKFYGMTGLTGNMIILSVLYYGGSLVTSDVLSVGNLASFVLYAAYVGIGLSGMSSFYAEIMKGLGASSRIFEIVDDKSNLIQSKSIEAGAKVPDLNRDIIFKDVSFSYPSRPDIKIFDQLNLTVPSKQVLAIVGSSGSGKSTVSSLLLRLYDPEQGSVLIGDTNLRDLNIFDLRKRIGTVTQEPVLFSTSIRDNISYGSRDPASVTMTDLIAAAKEANAHDFIEQFPQGYDTLVGERGVLLSGGQKQRIAIARAIVGDPEVLILDEATSALDAASEHEVKEALNRVMKGRTVITIAHRLSTIISAEKIVVLHKGKVVEEGSFAELNAIPNGFFKQLVVKQTINQQ